MAFIMLAWPFLRLAACSRGAQTLEDVEMERGTNNDIRGEIMDISF